MTTRPGSRWRGVQEMVRRLPGDPDPRTVAVVAIALAFVGYRTWLATQSGFGFHHGWNEGHYALIAHGFFDHPLVPRYGSNYIYSVPPLFPYLVAAGFALLGESVLVARLPSVLAAGGTIIATYALGRVVYGDRSVAALGASLLALLPYVQLYGGRAQTDMLMTFLFTAALGAIVYGYDGGGLGWLVAGGGLFAAAVATKQPAILLAPIVLLWLLLAGRTDRETYRRTAVLVLSSLVGLVPLFIWLFANYRLAPAAFVADWSRELFARTPPFANVPLLIGVGIGLGVTPTVAALAGYRLFGVARKHWGPSVYRAAGQPTVLAVWIAIYGALVLYRTPRGHQYYLIALTPPLVLLAARGFYDLRADFTHRCLRAAVAGLVLISAIGGTVVLFELSGEYSAANGGGETVAPGTADWLAEEVSADATVLVVNEYRPAVQWYLRKHVPRERVRSFLAAELGRAAIKRAIASHAGPVYVVYPSPSWGPDPFGERRPVYRSPAYEFTMLGLVGDRVTNHSKYRFYLEDRRLVVYQIA